MAVDQLQINERLFLKIPLEQDAKRISELVNKNRAEFKLYFSWCQQEESLAAAQAVIKKIISVWSKEQCTRLQSFMMNKLSA
ncbi:hypothetical protein [Oenococcus sicerae]|uniref:hypothetical protein n=1 Tax=Oenococcus sicerae TaxID=2203724 RepID=UPI0010B123BE|nr:hypothetical protein OAL24_01708 [Oenococcus sicerae]